MSFQLLSSEALNPAQIPFKDPHFKWAVEELMKESYRAADWAHFFSLARFYRMKFSNEEKSEVQLLEALALLRHCQSAPLNELLTQLQNQRAKTNSYSETLKQLKALSETRFKGKQAPDQQADLKPIQAHFLGTSFRRSSLAQFLNSDPRKSIIRVRNLCD